MKLYLNQTIKFTHEIELDELIQGNLDSVLDEIEDMARSHMIHGNLDEVVSILKENGFKISEECEDGSPDCEIEFEYS